MNTALILFLEASMNYQKLLQLLKFQSKSDEIMKLKVAVQNEVFTNPELIKKDANLVNHYRQKLVDDGVAPSYESAKSTTNNIIRKDYMSDDATTNFKKISKDSTWPAERKKKMSEYWTKFREGEKGTKVAWRDKRLATMRDRFIKKLKGVQEIYNRDSVDLNRAVEKFGDTKGRSLGRQLLSNKEDELVFMDSLLRDPDEELRALGKWWKDARKEYKEIYSPQTAKSLYTKLHTHKSGPGLEEARKWKEFKKKTGSKWVPEGLEGEHTMMWPDKYMLAKQGKFDVAKRFRQPEYPTTRQRNMKKNDLVSQLKVRLNKKYKAIDALRESVKRSNSGQPDPETVAELTRINALIADTSTHAQDLGLAIAIPDRAGNIKYFGGTYDNFMDLAKSYHKGVRPQGQDIIGPPKPLAEGVKFAAGGPVVEEETVDIFEDPVYEDVDEIDYKAEQAKMMGKKFDIGKSTPLNVADDIYQRRMDQSALLHKITGQPIEDVAKHLEKKHLDESNYSDATRSYIRSRENLREYEDEYRERVFTDIQETGFIRPETREWYDNLKYDQEYKDMTATLNEPQFQEARDNANKEIFMEQMKGHSWDMVDKVMDVYQVFNPFALAALSHKTTFDKQIKDFEYTYENWDYNNDNIPDIDQPGPLRDRVLGPEGLNFPEYTKKQMAQDALFAVLGGSTLIFGGPYSYANRLVKMLKNPNLSKTSKIIRFMPRILGVPTRKEAVELLKMVTTTPIKWGAKKIWNNFDRRLITNAAKIIALIEAAQIPEETKGRREYLDWVEKEKADPQYKDMYDEMFKWHLEVSLGKDPVERITEEDELKSPGVIEKEKKRWEDQPWQLRQMVEDDVEKWLKEHMNKKDKKLTQPGTPIHRTKGLAYGGDPNDLSSGMAGDDPYFDLKALDLDLEPFEPVEELDIFEESKQEVPSIPGRKTQDVFQAAEDAGFEEYQVANTVFGKVPGWAIKGLNKVDDLIQEGRQVKNLIKIGDEVAEATKSVGEKSNRFFSNIEAKLLDPDAPKVFDSPADLFNWFNSKGIGRIEIEDYQIPALLDTAGRMGRPITKEELLLRIKEAPIRKLKTKKLGFGTETGDVAKYGDQHMEKGYLPGTYRENILYLDAGDIPGDIGKYKHSQHGFFSDKEKKYVIGWTRSSDRPAIIPDVKAITDVTDKTKKLQTKIDRLTDITKMLPEEMSAKHTISLDQSRKNIAHAEKELKKAVKQLEEVGKGKAAAGGEQITVTFADEIQSDVFQTYRKHLQNAKKDYEEILARAISPRDKEKIKAMEWGDQAYEVKTDVDVIGYYDKYKDIMRPMFRTVEDFKDYIKELKKSQEVFTDFAKIQPGQMTKEQLKLVRASGKERDKVLQVFEEAFTSPEVMKKLFPNIPFKDRKAWGDALVKNDLHDAATRLFVTKDANAPTWYSISPEDLIQARYSQTGSTATPLANRTKDMKGIGTSEFYGGPNAADPNGKHFTSTLEAALRRAAKANNSEIKTIKVAVGEPRTKKHTVQVFSEETGNVIKEFKVSKTGGKEESLASAIEKAKKFIADSPYESINFKAVSTPSGFKTVDAYAIKLTPEMVLPSKTHMAAGGYVHSPFVSIDEVIGAHA